MSSGGVHKDTVLKNRDQNRLYLLLLFKRKPFVQQPQTLLEGAGSLKPESPVFLFMHLVYQEQYFDLN